MPPRPSPRQPGQLGQEAYLSHLTLGIGLAAFLLMWGLPHDAINLLAQDYLPVHTLLETVALVLTAGACWLLWQSSQERMRVGKALLTAALASVAVLDFGHMLSYQGMPLMVTPASPEKAIAFWLASRTMLTLGLLAQAFAPHGFTLARNQRHRIVLGALVLTYALYWVVLMRPHWLPRTFIAGQGLTTVKVAMEWGLIGALSLCAWQLNRQGRRLASRPHQVMSLACMLAAAAELCFASYSSVSDGFNLLGHLYKLAASAFLVRAAYLVEIRQPLEQLADLASALQNTANPTLICDPAGVVRWVNPSYLSVSGFTQEQVLGQDLAQLMTDSMADAPPHDAHEDPIAALQATLRNGRLWRGLVQAKKADGSTYTDDRTLTPMRDGHGRLTGFVVMGDDVTERNRQAHALMESEGRLRVLLESAPDGIVVINERGIVQMANPRVQNLLGFAAADLIGQNIRILMPDATAAMHDGFLQHYVRTGEHHIIGQGRDVVAQHRDGRPVHIHLTVGEAALPGGRVFIGFLRDITERIKAQEDLIDREARYRTLMASATDGVWVVDTQGRFVAVNESYERMSGYTHDELMCMRVSDVEARQSYADVQAHMAKVIQEGHDQFETVHQRKDGTQWAAEVSAVYALVGGGLFFMFVRDITDRKAADLQLKRSEERFQLALRASNDGLWDRDLLNGTIYFSPRWKSMLGYTEDELPNDPSTFDALLHPQDGFRVHLMVNELIHGEGGDRYEMEFRLRHKQGHWVEILSRAILQRDADGHPIRLIGTHHDITEQKRSQRAILESEEKLRRLFELSPLGIALCTMDGKLLECNQEFARLTGYSTQELLAMSYWDLTPPEYLPRELEQLAELSRVGHYGPYEKEFRTKQGPRVPVRLNGVQLELQGRPHIWSIIEDLTETRRQETERKQMERQQMQSQKLEALGHLTGGIAHDFNNMLAAILGLASLGLERHITDPHGKLARYLQEIVRTSERGRDLVAKMLTYARSESSEEAAPRDVTPIVSELDDMLSSSLPAGIELTQLIEPHLPPVRIKSVDLHQILMNLVLNARDAIGEHGRIQVSLGYRAVASPTCATCAHELAGDYVCLEVCDSGPGIPAALLPKIFDPFFTTKGVGKGTGLGLSSVQGIVHKVGGHVQVESMPGRTVFRVLLPAEPTALPQAEAAQPPLVALALRDRPLQAWVVDDDSAVLIYLTELLQEHGIAVRAFSDPTAAKQALRGEAPDILITDQTMPRLSGDELACEALTLHPHLCVILCTGFSDRIDEATAQAMGIRFYLRKPFDARELLSAIGSCVSPDRNPHQDSLTANSDGP